MKKALWVIIGITFYLVCTIFAPLELTMYIMRYAEQYGYFPAPALVMETDLIMELIAIWFFYVLGLAFVIWLISIRAKGNVRG